MLSVLILGRQPELGISELESLYSDRALTPLGQRAVIVDSGDEAVDFDRLGGSTRLCELISYIPGKDWSNTSTYLEKAVLEIVDTLPEGKIRLGISYFGGGVSPRVINTTGLRLKKIVKATGKSVRVVPNTTPELNTAQVLHNQLDGPTGIELVLVVSDGGRIALARTLKVQDINAYAARDQRRPKRDARVGMLPPKLAQIIINLAVGKDLYKTDASTTILDPFCGTGVVLQEALLMGYGAYGTDLEPRMVDYSQENLDWLTSNPHNDIPSSGDASPSFYLEAGDATRHRWHKFDVIACETYLGRALSGLPAPEKLAEIMSDCDSIHRKFLINLAKQSKSGARLCIAVPAWKTKTGFKHLRTLDSLEELGYNRLRFVHVRSNDLIYHRPDQIVGRELVILERK